MLFAWEMEVINLLVQKVLQGNSSQFIIYFNFSFCSLAPLIIFYIIGSLEMGGLRILNQGFILSTKRF